MRKTTRGTKNEGEKMRYLKPLWGLTVLSKQPDTIIREKPKIRNIIGDIIIHKQNCKYKITFPKSCSLTSLPFLHQKTCKETWCGQGAHG